MFLEARADLGGPWVDRPKGVDLVMWSELAKTWVPMIISVVALVVSAATWWQTLLRRGDLRMTHPSVICFGPDGSQDTAGRGKVFLRTLLYSTSHRGHTVESLYLNLRNHHGSQRFPIWVYGSRDVLTRGSGLFVPREGVAHDHHFLLSVQMPDFKFLPGEYTLEVWARVAGRIKPWRLQTLKIEINGSHSAHLQASGAAGVYFDWVPDQNEYHVSIREDVTAKLPRFVDGAQSARQAMD